jgi:adenine-specific DNA-methyltransferase
MTEVARESRKEPTPGEALLWQALRNRRLDGRKFRRQQPIGPFVVDFYCAEERLVVEVDGPVHLGQVQSDRERQALLESLGLRFLRVNTAQVESDLEHVLTTIRTALSDPSPSLGEGLGVRAGRDEGRG